MERLLFILIGRGSGQPPAVGKLCIRTILERSRTQGKKMIDIRRCLA